VREVVPPCPCDCPTSTSRYQSRQAKILAALDAADRVAKDLIRAAGQRACAVTKGANRPVERQTRRINRLYLEWVEHMHRAHRLVKAAKMWGDPTVPFESLYEPTDSDGDEAA
jgi:hypothetical protein